MRKSLLLSVLAGSALFFSCKNSTVETTSKNEKEVKIVADFSSLGLDSTQTYYLSGLLLGHIEKDSMAALVHEGKGVYSASFDLPESFGYVQGRFGNIRFNTFLSQGDSVHISIDQSGMVEATGTNSDIYAFEKKIGEKVKEFKNGYAVFQYPEDSFKIAVDAFYSGIQKDIDDAKLGNQAYVNTIKAEFVLNKFIDKINYPNYYKYFKQTAPELSADYYAFKDDLSFLSDSNVVNTNSFTNLFSAYTQMEIGEEGMEKITKQQEFTDLILKTAEGKVKDQKQKDRLIYEFIDQVIQYDEPSESLKSYVSTHASSLSNEVYKEKLMSKLAGIAPFMPGQPAMDFSYPDMDGKMVSLSDFKGKYVYVDVWATWCGPCKKEIPFLKALEKEMHSKNIVFMSVSVDEEDSEQAWKDFVKENELGGVQLYAKGWSKITKDYKITGIPRFMLFDPEGKIVSVSAKRPSDEKLKPELLAFQGI